MNLQEFNCFFFLAPIEVEIKNASMVWKHFLL